MWRRSASAAAWASPWRWRPYNRSHRAGGARRGRRARQGQLAAGVLRPAARHGERDCRCAARGESCRRSFTEFSDRPEGASGWTTRRPRTWPGDRRVLPLAPTIGAGSFSAGFGRCDVSRSLVPDCAAARGRLRCQAIPIGRGAIRKDGDRDRLIATALDGRYQPYFSVGDAPASPHHRGSRERLRTQPTQRLLGSRFGEWLGRLGAFKGSTRAARASSKLL